MRDLTQVTMEVLEQIAVAVPAPVRGTEHSYIELPAAQGADYRFTLYLYDDGEPQIAAKLARDPNSYFWYRPYEEPDFASQEERINSFSSELKLVLTCPTRIVQRRGLLFWSFRCEVEEEHNWRRLGPGMSALRPMVRVNASGRTSVFTSPPLAVNQ